MVCLFRILYFKVCWNRLAQSDLWLASDLLCCRMTSPLVRGHVTGLLLFHGNIQGSSRPGLRSQACQRILKKFNIAFLMQHTTWQTMLTLATNCRICTTDWVRHNSGTELQSQWPVNWAWPLVMKLDYVGLQSADKLARPQTGQEKVGYSSYIDKPMHLVAVHVASYLCNKQSMCSC